MTMLHLLIQIALAAAALILIWLGIDSFRRTREMRKTGRNVRNLLGMTPWYSYFIADEAMREKVIINHNYIVAMAAIMLESEPR
jgi:hypothetical protein